MLSICMASIKKQRISRYVTTTPRLINENYIFNIKERVKETTIIMLLTIQCKPKCNNIYYYFYCVAHYIFTI